MAYGELFLDPGHDPAKACSSAQSNTLVHGPVLTWAVHERLMTLGTVNCSANESLSSRLRAAPASLRKRPGCPKKASEADAYPFLIFTLTKTLKYACSLTKEDLFGIFIRDDRGLIHRFSL